MRASAGMRRSTRCTRLPRQSAHVASSIATTRSSFRVPRAPAPIEAFVHTEIELKLSVDPGAATAPLRHPAVKALRAGRTRTARVDSSYYDTDDSLLAHA